MRTVKLYGELAEFTGRKEIVADIADVGEHILSNDEAANNLAYFPRIKLEEYHILLIQLL